MSAAEKEADELLTVEEEQIGTRNGYPLMEGERYSKSPISDQWYRLTRWEKRGDGKQRAVEKKPVDESTVEEAIER